MRIGVSGTHGTGKTTLVAELCGRLPGHTGIDEPYVLLEEDGHDFEFPPSPEDYRAQLTRSLLELRSPASTVIFDRTPLDFLAYLAAVGARVDAEADTSAVASALASLDLLVVVPITPGTEQVLPRAELPRLREKVNDTLLDLLYNDPLQILGNVPVIELTGPIDGRPEAVLAALAAETRHGDQARKPATACAEPGF